MRIAEHDFHEGDIVQIKSKNKRYNGRTGQIIGIIWLEGRKEDASFFSYTVKFSDNESRSFIARDMRKVRSREYEKGRKDITYETR